MDLIRQGSVGPQVEMAQLALRRAGLDPGAPDGIFGSRTDQAVRQFQRREGLLSDGIVGPDTWNALTPYLLGYVVRKAQRGDTFYQLAKRYGIPVELLMAANPDTNAANIVIGQSLVIPFSFPVVSGEISITSELLALYIRGITARYPFVSSGSIGQSVLGRPLSVLRIGTGRSTMLFNASHHANEWITTPVVLSFLEEYAQATVLGKSIGDYPAADLYRKTTLHLIPLVNPDGVDLVTGAFPEESGAYRGAQAIAADYPAIPFPSGWKANIVGVDLNLNYPAGWENAKEIKYEQGFRSPAPRDFVGPEPLSEPESRAMADYTVSNSFKLTLSYHTQGNVIYWKFLDYLPPNSLEIGKKLAEASGYELELTPAASGYAGYKDWFIQTYNLPGYTIEAGIGVSPLPLSQFDEIYAANKKLMAVALAQG